MTLCILRGTLFVSYLSDSHNTRVTRQSWHIFLISEQEMTLICDSGIPLIYCSSYRVEILIFIKMRPLLYITHSYLCADKSLITLLFRQPSYGLCKGYLNSYTAIIYLCTLNSVSYQ